MRLATVPDGSRDGQLVVVSESMLHYQVVGQAVPNFQYALDNWVECRPILLDAAERVESSVEARPVTSTVNFCAPLPRAYEWIDASAFLPHVRRARAARKADLPPNFETEPLVYQGGSGHLLGHREVFKVQDSDWLADFEAEVCVFVTDLVQGASLEQAADAILFVGLANDWSLRGLAPQELRKGFGFLQSKPATAFSPFVVSKDALGSGWLDDRPNFLVRVERNGSIFGDLHTREMHFSFAEILSHIVKTRALTAGTIVGSGTVSVASVDSGFGCVLEKRMQEVLDGAEARTEFVQPGERVRIYANTMDGTDLFGVIEQEVVSATPKE